MIYGCALSVSHGQLILNWLALFEWLEVVEQEVDVEAGLQDARHHLGPAEEIFHLVSVDPIQHETLHF